MNFNVDTQKSSFNVNTSFDKMKDERAEQRDNTQTDSLANVGVIGLKAGEIPNMKAAITTMCDNIQNKVNEMQTEISSLDAYKGTDIDAALKNYLANVAAYCNNLTSNLKAFNDKLTDVEKAWAAATSSMSEKISGNAGNFATGSQYTETLQ